ncbi:ANTAR domain-containing response regulator [Chthonobacter albigriseus]|uniref:ANTAR domain-containing response regulator n=1 Tax=Chthonobacter albigriseus TaxID=1683161 RepID=UPI0015EF9D78|nr:ANTAR domain-containing protein [Chthonobacter albigriseus]
MTGPRILQNFSGGTVHLVAADPRAADALASTLVKFGVDLRVVPLVDGKAALDLAALREDRDVLVVDGDLDLPLDLAGGAGETFPVVPVIGLIGVEAPSRLKALMQIGATAFLRKPIHGAAVYSALFMGINGFLRRRYLETRLEDHERRRRGRRFVIKAIVNLMHRAGIDDDQAYAILRRESMRRRVSIEDYCTTLLRAGTGDDAGPEQVPAARRSAQHE